MLKILSLTVTLLLGGFAIEGENLFAETPGLTQTAVEPFHWKSTWGNQFSYPEGEEVCVAEFVAFLNECFANKISYASEIPELPFICYNLYNLMSYNPLEWSSSGCGPIFQEADNFTYRYVVSEGHEHDIIDGIRSLQMWSYFLEWRKSPSLDEMCDYLNACFSGDQETANSIKNRSYLKLPVRTANNPVYTFDENATTPRRFYIEQCTLYPFDIADKLVSSIKEAQEQGAAGSYDWWYEMPDGGRSFITITYDQNQASASFYYKPECFYRVIWAKEWQESHKE